MQLSAPLKSDIDKPWQYPHWEYINIFSLSTSTLGFNKIQQLIKSKFVLNLKPWQVSVVAEITKSKKDVVIIADTSASKSFPYQLILLIIGDSIILVVLPIIVLIED